MTVSRFITLLLLLAGVFGVGWWAGSSNPELLQTSTTESSTTAPAEVERVVAQGKLVPASGIFNVIAPPGQQIEQVLVKENEIVKANETRLAVLAGEEILELQTELVDAQSADGERELDQKILLAQSNLLAAKGAVRTAELQLDQARQSVDLSVAEKQIAAADGKINRLQGLAGDPETMLYVSQSAVSDQQLKIDQSRAELDAMKRKQAAAKQAAELGLDVAKQSMEAAEKALKSLTELKSENKTLQLTQAIAKDRREKAKILAPVDGTILKVFIKEGEAMTTSPLMQIADLSEMECVAEVVDRLVTRVAQGQRVTLTSPALPRELKGTVTSIGKFVGNSTMSVPSPLALVDRKTVDVRIKLDAADSELASQLVNLQVDVEIETGSSSGSTETEAKE